MEARMDHAAADAEVEEAVTSTTETSEPVSQGERARMAAGRKEASLDNDESPSRNGPYSMS